MTRPLPATATGPARAYLGAMLPPGEVSDAWHDLEADVAYWGDQDLGSILHLAHEIVRQRVRVTDEVAALSLSQDAGVEDADVVARCLGVDADTARDLLRRAMDATTPEEVTSRFSGSTDSPAVQPDVRPAVQPEARPGPRPQVRPEPARLTFDDTAASADAPKVWAGADRPVVDDGGPAKGRPRTRAVLVWGVGIWAVVLLAWLLGLFD